MNLFQYINEVSNGITVESLDETKLHFKERAYNFNSAMNPYLARLQYYKAVRSGNEEEITRFSYIVDSSIPTKSSEEIMALEPVKIEADIVETTDLCQRISMLKYRDGVNQLWSEPWHFETRSSLCCYIGDPENGDYDVTGVMPRGAEVAGHKKFNITNIQDITDVNDEEEKSKFAPPIQKIITSINNGTECEDFLEIVASSKRDGMCFRLFCINKQSKSFDLLTRAVRIVDDKLVDRFVSLSLAMSEGEWMMIPASNGTLFLTHPGVINWMMCSMAISAGVSHEKLCQSASEGVQSLDVVDKGILEKFIKDLLKLNDNPKLSKIVNVHAFEAIGGPNRKCAYDKEEHVELATSYSSDQCGLSYLGAAFNDEIHDLNWIPHFELENDFYVPTYWKFSSITSTRKGLDGMANVFSGDITWDEFFRQYPRANENVRKTMIPDPEGFVLYIKMLVDGKEKWIYCKAKTWMYYMLHKIKSKDLHSIIRMPEKFGEAFPGYQKVNDFFNNYEKFKGMITELCTRVDNPNLICTVKEKGRRTVDAARKRGDNSLIFKIVLNGSSNTAWKTECMPIVTKYFDELQIISDEPDSRNEVLTEATGKYDSTFLSQMRADCAQAIKGIMMELRCFNEGWEQNLKDSLDREKIIAQGKILKNFKHFWDILEM